MVSKSRAIRIAERMREELSEILLTKSMDPRLIGLSVTDVKVDRELAYAEIYVCALEGVERSESYMAALEHAQGYLRSELARRVELRAMPRLRWPSRPMCRKRTGAWPGLQPTRAWASVRWNGCGLPSTPSLVRPICSATRLPGRW